MEGAALRQKREYDLALSAAWHTEAFARTKKLPKLADMIGADDIIRAPNKKHAQAIAFFHRLKADGVPVNITKNEIN